MKCEHIYTRGIKKDTFCNVEVKEGIPRCNKHIISYYRKSAKNNTTLSPEAETEPKNSIDTTSSCYATNPDINNVIPSHISLDNSKSSNEVPTSCQSSKNKGTGAGGANTNKSGLFYEKTTSLIDMYTVLSKSTSKSTKKTSTQYINFNNYTQTYVYASKNDFIKYMDPNKKKKYAHGCKSPDECYIDETNKKIFIIEKKFQGGSGSVCEKIQSVSFKQWHYSRIFPEYKIVYIYCLSDWFKSNCKVELEYMKEHSIPVFWGDSPSYKTDIVNFICNHSQ